MPQKSRAQIAQRRRRAVEAISKMRMSRVAEAKRRNAALAREAQKRKKSGLQEIGLKESGGLLPDKIPEFKSKKDTTVLKKAKIVREAVVERLGGLKRARIPSERKLLGELQDRNDLKIVESEYKKVAAQKRTADRVQKLSSELEKSKSKLKEVELLESQLEKKKSKLKEQVESLELLKKKLAKTMETKKNVSSGGGSGGVIGSGTVDIDGDDDDEDRSVDSDTTCLVNLLEEEEEVEPPKKKKKMAMTTAVKKTRTAASS